MKKIRFRFKIVCCMAVLLPGILAVGPVSAEEVLLRYQYRDGDQYRIESVVDEDVFINGRFSHHAEILNRISVTIEDTADGSGKLRGRFITAENRSGSVAVYQLNQEYDTVFWRDAQGYYDIDPRYFMPVVRDVPVFPAYPISPGYSWRAEGHEVHDLRAGYGIPDAFRFPIQVEYRYLGKGDYEGKEYDIISIQYSILHRTSGNYRQFPIYPVRISGYSEQILYWDNWMGKPYAYEEEFSILFDLSTGDAYEFTGTAHARVVESRLMDRPGVADDIRRQIEDRRIDDAVVQVSEDGVTITLENIRFEPDSARLLESEKAKLDRISEILMMYPERNIMITGHTALAGTEEGRQRLSEERALVTGSYIIATGAKSPESIITNGMGARRPIADNTTPEGMARNRRVEITILEN